MYKVIYWYWIISSSWNIKMCQTGSPVPEKNTLKKNPSLIRVKIQNSREAIVSSFIPLTLLCNQLLPVRSVRAILYYVNRWMVRLMVYYVNRSLNLKKEQVIKSDLYGDGKSQIWSKFQGEHPCRSVISIKFLAALLKSQFGMGVLLLIYCIFSEDLFLRTPLDDCFWIMTSTNQFRLKH